MPLARGDERGPGCTSCRYFVDDPFRIEAELPALTALSSALGSARGRAGLCSVLGILTDPGPACPDFAARRPGEGVTGA